MCSCFVFLIALQAKGWKNFKPLCTYAIAQDFDFRVAAYSPRLWDKIWGTASILYFEILKLRKRSKTWRKYAKWCSVVSTKWWAKMCICKEYKTEYRRENTETEEEKQRQMETKRHGRRNEQKREWRQRNYRKRNMKSSRRQCKILGYLIRIQIWSLRWKTFKHGINSAGTLKRKSAFQVFPKRS